jgi:hypothetical protein
VFGKFHNVQITPNNEPTGLLRSNNVVLV